MKTFRPVAIEKQITMHNAWAVAAYTFRNGNEGDAIVINPDYEGFGGAIEGWGL